MPTSRSEPPGRQAAAPLARIVFGLLALAAVAALLIAQQLKGHQALVGSGDWRPIGAFDPSTQTAWVSFTTAYSDRLTISVVSARTGTVVAKLATNYPLRADHRSKTFLWNGRTKSGSFAPNGDYDVTVHFQRLDRTPGIPGVEFELKR